jgi:hypothetical protein
MKVDLLKAADLMWPFLDDVTKRSKEWPMTSATAGQATHVF